LTAPVFIAPQPSPATVTLILFAARLPDEAAQFPPATRTIRSGGFEVYGDSAYADGQT
jgi:hypothetical protein